MIDLAIWSRRQPAAAAAWAAVRVSDGISRICVSIPASVSARRTRARLLLIVHLPPLLRRLKDTCKKLAKRSRKRLPLPVPRAQSSAMSFAARMTRCPLPYEPERGAEAADRFGDHPREIRELIAGAGGCSPYLKSLIDKETDWLAQTLDGAPEAALTGVLDDMRALQAADLKPGLRRAKRRAALLIALADLGGVWPLEQVTGGLTDVADLATDRALKAMVAAELARGKLPAMTSDDAAGAGGMVALAMGKMGAHELNYSSDIDLIMLFDGDHYDADDYHDARAALVRATRHMAALLSEMTGDGYVFRTDLRLRPDAAVTPVCLSMDAAESYYESVGRTWERAAYIKARPAAGDLAAGDRFLERLRPFIWRKHLDFAAIQDAHDMRLRIREHKGFGARLVLEGHNMKLGRGRHPRDRVLHPDPPDHRRRPRPVAAGARHARRAGAAGRKGLGRAGDGRRPSPPPTATTARSSTACR